MAFGTNTTGDTLPSRFQFPKMPGGRPPGKPGAKGPGKPKAGKPKAGKAKKP